MITKSVTYTDFDGEIQTDLLHFHISKTDLSGELSLMDRVSKMEARLRGPERELTIPEKQEVLDLVKTIVRLSYGVRDGKLFRKTPEIWADFAASAAYDELLWKLFNDDTEVFTFVISVLPKDLRDAAEEKAREVNPEAYASITKTQESPQVETPSTPASPENDLPAWIKEGRQPTPQEWAEATPDQIQLAFKKRQGQ